MGRQQRVRNAIAVLGVVATTAAAAGLGYVSWTEGSDVLSRMLTPEPAARGGAERGKAAALATDVAALPEASTPRRGPADAPAKREDPVSPSFDVVRVEPTGEAVIAGRGPAGATIEMLRDGRLHSRVVADPSGLFALVPPALPPGTHQITLVSIAPDGTRQQSRESVTIVISPDRDRKPLVALAAPDQPTVVLSNPDSVEAKAADVPPAAAKPAQVKIVSVEAEEGGRLYVSGLAPAGATVRLYLNESLIAPGGAGQDGKISFAIERGVRPGAYRVRLDEVDPVSGDVKSRAEVPFTVPVAVAVPLPPPVGPVEIGPKVAELGQRSDAAPDGAVRREGTQVAAAGPGQDLEVGSVVIPNVNTVVVSRGESLWRIAQRMYGTGHRFTVIFGANQEQIKDPDLIYPGQTFVLPTNPTQAR